MPKKRRRARGKGTVYLKKGEGYYARRWVTEPDGTEVRKSTKLHTWDKGDAKRLLDRLVAQDGPAPAEALDLTETFQEAALRVIEQQTNAGKGQCAKDRKARLKKYAFPKIGGLLVTKIGRPKLIEVLQGAAKQGKSQQTLEHLRKDLSVVFRDLLVNRQIDFNPCVELRSAMPAAPKDERPRMLLLDEHVEAFVSAPTVPAQLRVLAFASRTLGGMRTSDLHAWDWSWIDWASGTTKIVRPKTDDKARHVMLPEFLTTLKEWWLACGRPLAGPVFAAKGKGTQKKKSSYAKALRRELWRLGLHVPMAGWDPAKPAKELDAYQMDTTQTRAVDFHSFRRAYCTGLAIAGVNTATAMQLAGHKSHVTHMRYVQAAQELATPEAALPRFKRSAK